MAITHFLSQNKTELKIFFVIWLCLFFIFSPVSMGLYLTPKIEKQEAKAWLANIVLDAAEWVWKGVMWVWDKAQDWAIAAWSWLQENVWRLLKEAALAALKMLLHQILGKVTNSIVQWIQSDFHGQPGFITDWDDYLRSSADAAAGRFLNTFFNINLCSPFAVSVKMAISLPVPTFNTAAECTLTGIVSNVEDFYNDFTKGGWIAWKASLDPNNNAFGTMLMALNKKAADEFAAQQKSGKEAKSGFKPIKKCLSATTVDTVTSEGAWNTAFSDCLNNGEGNATECSSIATARTSADASAKIAQVSTVADASTIDPNSGDCSSSITTAPDGTVEFTTNFSATSAMRSLEAEISNLMGSGSGATFTPYIMAITNALITQLVNKSMTGLLGALQGDPDTGDPLPTYNPDTDPTLFKNEISGISEQSTEFEEIMDDLAETEKTKGNLDVAESEGIASLAIAEYDLVRDRIAEIKSKQLSIITDFWADKNWGTEATVGQTKISTTTIESCSGSPVTCTIIATPTATTSIDITNYVKVTTTQVEYCSVSASTSLTTCSIVATLPWPTSLTNYVHSTTNTVITNLVSHPQIGQAPIVETSIQVTDTRTTDPGNYDAVTGNQLANYDSSSYSYSLQSPKDPADNTYKCQSDYSPSTIICQIDIDNTDPTSGYYSLRSDELLNMPSLIQNTKSALDSFADAAEIYISKFESDPSSCATIGSACYTAKTNTIASRDSVISALQIITGDTSSTTIKDLNTSLSKIIKDTSSVSSTAITVTITASDGTTSQENANSYYQTYLNDLIIMYNSL